MKRVPVSPADDSVRRFGPGLVRLRTARKLSQLQLAEAAGISRAQISELETGKATPRLDAIYRLAHGLGLPAAALLVAGPRPEPAGWEIIARRLPLTYEQALTLSQLLEAAGVAETASAEEALLLWMSHRNVLP